MREPDERDAPTSRVTGGRATPGSARESASDPADEPVTGAPAGAADKTAAYPAGRARVGAARRRMWGFGPVSDGRPDDKQRRRRRWFVAGVSVAGAVIVIALCAGALSVLS